MQETGTVGPVQVRAPQSVLVGSTQVLLHSIDPTFATGTTLVTLAAGASVYEATLDFTNGEYFTFAAVPATAPGGVSGVQLWLKADAGTTVNASNNFVNGTGWLDQSGFGRHGNMVFGDPQVHDGRPQRHQLQSDRRLRRERLLPVHQQSLRDGLRRR